MLRIKTITCLFLFSLSLEGYCLNRTTGCLITARYSPRNDTVISNGNPLFFENQSSNANSYTWFVNGVLASLQKDFTFAPSLGVNEIKLVASDGKCSDTSFSFIIWDGNTGVQYKNFQKQFHPAGMARNHLYGSRPNRRIPAGWRLLFARCKQFYFQNDLPPPY